MGGAEAARALPFPLSKWQARLWAAQVMVAGRRQALAANQLEAPLQCLCKLVGGLATIRAVLTVLGVSHAIWRHVAVWHQLALQSWQLGRIAALRALEEREEMEARLALQRPPSALPAGAMVLLMVHGSCQPHNRALRQK
jgi:hypothetical protein